MESIQAKGVNFRSFVSVLKKLEGDAGVARTIALLPPDLGEALRLGAITTVGWYPIEWYSKLHSAAQMACGGSSDFSRMIARESVKEDFKTGVHRLVTFTLAPETMFKLAQRVLSAYWSGGRCVIERAEPGRAMGRFEGFTGFDRNLWDDIVGGSMGVLEVGGAKNVIPRVLAGGADGDSNMTYQVRWG